MSFSESNGCRNWPTMREPLHKFYSGTDSIYSEKNELLKSVKPVNNHKRGETRKAFLILLFIFFFSILSLAFLYASFPELKESEKVHFKLPRNLEDAKKLGRVLYNYKDMYFLQVLGGVFIVYIFLQTFAIPGSIFLSIMSGFLFPFWIALLLVCFCSAVGATFCYLLSYLVGRKLVHRYIPERIASWSAEVDRQRNHLLNYILFLRITPFLPNWFINIASPVLNVSLTPFFWGTFLGVAPPSFVAIKAGQTLQQLSSTGDAVSWRSTMILALLALVSIAPVIFKQRLKAKLL